MYTYLSLVTLQCIPHMYLVYKRLYACIHMYSLGSENKVQQFFFLD